MIGHATMYSDITTPRGALVVLWVANLSEEVGVPKVSKIKAVGKEDNTRELVMQTTRKQDSYQTFHGSA